MFHLANIQQTGFSKIRPIIKDKTFTFTCTIFYYFLNHSPIFTCMLRILDTVVLLLIGCGRWIQFTVYEPFHQWFRVGVSRRTLPYIIGQTE